MTTQQKPLRKLSDPNSMTPEERALTIGILKRLTTPLRKDLNASDDLIETMYAIAHNFYKVGDYENAAKLFHGLTVLDHMDSRFWKGLAACRHLSGHLRAAADAYTVAMITDLDNADTFLHASECLIALGFFIPARETLKRCLEITSEDTEKWSLIHARAGALVQALQRKARKESKS